MTRLGRRPAPHRNPTLGAVAGLLAFALLAGILGGVAWGFLRPAYIAVAGEGGAVQVDQAASPRNVEFVAFGWFTLITTAIGILIAVFAWRATRGERTRGGAGWVWWAALCALASAGAVYVFGDWIAAVRLDIPDHDAITSGQRFTAIPPVSPSAGWVAGPFTAAFGYWLANLLAYLNQNSATAPQTGPQQSD